MIKKLKRYIKKLYWSFRSLLFWLIPKLFSKKLKIGNLGTVLIISPHPDDETLGCAMLIKSLVENHQKVKIIILSRGEGAMPETELPLETVAKIRKELAIRAIGIMGLKSNDLSVLNFPDGRFADVCDDEIIELEKEIENYNPDTIFIPHPWEFSSDHMFASDVLRRLLKAKKKYNLLYYCVWVYYHMPLIKIFQLNYLRSFKHQGDRKTKHKAIDIYLNCKDKNGNCFSGFLPQEFLEAVATNRELYFEV